MAGNAKEGCWISARDARYILGRSWTEPESEYDLPDARDPFARSASTGFRCVRYLCSGPLAEALTRPVESHPTRDYTKEKPVSDAAFRIYRSLYSYDRTPLNPVLETADNSAEYWRKERISYDAAYGNERILAHLYLPKKAAPPYQTVIYFPHMGSLEKRSSEDPEMVYLDFLIR